MADTEGRSERASLGARIKEAREYAGFSQEEVARYLEIPRSAVSMIETGGRRIDILEVQRLAKLFQCGVDDLMPSEGDQYGDAPSIRMLARAAAELDEADRDEVLRFARLLQGRARESKD